MQTAGKALPLSGVLVVAVEVAATGPLCTRNLAELGARVIRIERHGEPDPTRTVDRVFDAWSSFDLWVNTSKESVSFNVKHPRGRDILLRLINRADVLLTNLKPGAAEEIGLKYDVLKERNPRLVYCQISGFGQDGPYAQRKAFDAIIQGEAGLIELTGTPEAPARLGAIVSDTVGGLYATIGVLTALMEARATGLGQYIDVSMLESTVWFLANFPYRYWSSGLVPPRMGARHPVYCPYGVYEASEGKINIAVLTDPMWRGFCQAIERPDLLADQRFVSMATRGNHKDDLNAIVEPILRLRPAAEWIDALEAAGIPCGLVRTLGEVLEHPQLKHRGFISELDSEHGPIKLFSLPIKFEDGYRRPRSLPPGIGADTMHVLEELGFDEGEISALRGEGVI